MATATPELQATGSSPVDKGLKSGALGLVSTTIIATASVAPAYSLAATLVFVVVAVALQSPTVAVLAFVPMLLTSIGYSELNKADPDCGTTLHLGDQGVRPHGPAGPAAGPSSPPTSWSWPAWPRWPGSTCSCCSTPRASGPTRPAAGCCWSACIWIVVMTYICYRGIEVSANFQKVLLGIELVMLLVLSVTALVKVGTGHRPARSPDPEPVLAQPVPHHRFSAFASGIILMVFIYWGWDTAGRGQRGDQGQEQDPGPGGHPVHVHPAGHLRAGDLLHAVVRRDQDHGQRPGQRGERR